MRLDHVGYITEQIEDTLQEFLNLGYTPESIVDFAAHQCKVCLLRKEGETAVELVQPYESNKSLRRLLKNGVSPYHVCYEVEDIYQRVTELTIGSGGYLPLSPPVAAPAFGDRQICYLWSRETGYIELLQRDNQTINKYGKE